VSVENDSSARKQACVVYVSEYLEKQIGRRFYLFRAKISLFGFEFWHGSSRRRIIYTSHVAKSTRYVHHNTHNTHKYTQKCTKNTQHFITHSSHNAHTTQCNTQRTTHAMQHAAHDTRNANHTRKHTTRKTTSQHHATLQTQYMQHTCNTPTTQPLTLPLLQCHRVEGDC
jgi:hypothetical protein